MSGNELMVLDVQRVRAERVGKGMNFDGAVNENIIGVKWGIDPRYGTPILFVTARQLANRKFFRRENITLSLWEVEKAQILQIPNAGNLELPEESGEGSSKAVSWVMQDEFGKLYVSYQLVIIDDKHGKRIFAEGSREFCYLSDRELRRQFAEQNGEEHRAEIEKLLKKAESLAPFGKAEEENIEKLLDRARELADWGDLASFEYETWVRQEAFRISRSIRVGDSVLGGVQFKFKVV